MKQTLTLADKLLARLQKLGLTERKAKPLAKGVASTAPRIKGNVTEKLTLRLVKLGLTERKATALAKGLAPTVRTAIKAKAKAVKKKLDDVDDAFVNEIVDEGVDLTENEDLDKVAPRVNGHRVRLDLPVINRRTWMSHLVRGVELLRVMDGLTTDRTYLVAAVKKDVGIVAVRQFDSNSYNVKFYPTMAYWDFTSEGLSEIGATNYYRREWYERMYFSHEALQVLMRRLEVQATAKAKVKALMQRFFVVGSRPLVKAFDYLSGRKSVAA